MSSTNDAVFQRRNKQIEDAIDAQNLKQALQLIEKRIKKGEDTRFMKVGFAELVFLFYMPSSYAKSNCFEDVLSCVFPVPC